MEPIIPTMDIATALFKLSNQRDFKAEEVSALDVAIKDIKDRYQFSFNELDTIKIQRNQLVIDKNQIGAERDAYLSERDSLKLEVQSLKALLPVAESSILK